MMISLRWMTVLALCVGLALIAPTCQNNPLFFDQGLASGDVTEDSAVLWTRTNGLAIMRLEVSTTINFPFPLAYAETIFALPLNDFTVKVTATGLAPDTQYFYRWRHGNANSQTGKFRTAPVPNAAASARFAFWS